MEDLHFTIGGIAATAGAVVGVVRLVQVIRPWFAWRRRVDVRLAALENPEDVKAVKQQLLEK